MMRLGTTLGIGLIFLLIQSASHAQTYPAKPVTVIVPQATGGANDAVARLVAQKLSANVGQSFIVDNRVGAGGNVGTGVAARSSRDGYTLLLTAGSAHTINPSLYKSVPFHPVKDFEPVGIIATAPYVLVVNPFLGVKSAQELVALAKSKPGQIHIASAGNGSLDHLLGEMFKSSAGIDLVHVPYKGATAANTDLVTGAVSVTFTSWPSVMSFVKAGRVNLVAVASPSRSPLLPQVPTVAENIPGVAAISWYGLFAPAGTPAPILGRLRAELGKVLADEQFRQALNNQGAEVATASHEQFASLIKTDLQKFGEIIKRTGARID